MSGNNVILRDANTIALGASTVSNDFSVTAGSSISIASGITVSAVGNLTLTGSGILPGNYRGIDSAGTILGGTVNVSGTGGDTGLYNYGVYIHDNGQITSSGAGSVTVTGTGRNSAMGYSLGVYVLSGGQITSGGAGTVSVTGTGGSLMGYNYGICVSETNSKITSGGGNVVVTGYAGNGTANFNYGVYIASSGQITSGGTGTVLVTGTGGNIGTSSNVGVTLGGAGVITSGGSGAVTVIGTGGDGDFCDGVLVSGTGSKITSGGGNVEVTGTGKISGGMVGGASNLGVDVFEGGEITSGGGNVTVIGTGSGHASGDFNTGVYIGTYSGSLFFSKITSGGGNVTVTGTGGSGSSSTNNVGICISNNGQITSTLTGNVTVNGTGGVGSTNYGISLFPTNASTAVISSPNSTVSITGTSTGAEELVLAANSLISAGGAGGITLDTKIDGAYALTLDGNAAVNRIVGSTSPLASLEVTGTTSLGANVTTSTTQTYTGAATLTADATLTGSIATFGNMLNGTVAGQQYLAVSGNAVFSNTVGSTALEYLTVSGTSLLGGNVTTAGNQTYTGAVTLTGNSSLTTTDSPINLLGGVDGSYNLSTASGSSMTTLGSGSNINIGTGILTNISGFFVTNGGNITSGGLAINGGIFNFAGDAWVWDINGNVSISSGAILIATSGTMTVSGNWSNSDTFMANGGTVIFDGTSSGKTITARDSNGAFYNISFTGSGGEWTLQDDMTVSNTFAVTNGSFVSGSNTVLISGANASYSVSDTTKTNWSNGTLDIQTDVSPTLMPSNEGYNNLTLGRYTDGSGTTVYDILDTNSTILGDFTIDYNAKLLLTFVATGVSKVYTGTTAATVTFTDNHSPVAERYGTYTYAYTADFSIPNVGTTISISVTGISLTGTDSAKYELASESASTTANITAATLTYDATAASRLYGVANPAFTGTVTGFVNGETIATATTGTLAFNSTATVLSNVGSYAIDGSGLTANFGNYTFVQDAGNATALSITPASLTITANNQSKSYGSTFTFAGTEFTDAGLVNGDTVTSVTLASAATAATATVAGSPYAITASAAVGTGLSNYAISYNDGSFAVTAKTLTITADSQTKVYGSTFTFTGTEFTDAGLVNGDTVTSVTLASSGSPASATAGTYSITVSTAVGTGLSNYTISYVNGAFIVTGDFNGNNAGINDGTVLSTVLDNTASPINSSSYPNANFGASPWDKMMSARRAEGLSSSYQGLRQGMGVFNPDTLHPVFQVNGGHDVSDVLEYNGAEVENDDDNSQGSSSEPETAMIFGAYDDYLSMIANITDGNGSYSISVEKHHLFKTTTDLYLEAIIAG